MEVIYVLLGSLARVRRGDHPETDRRSLARFFRFGAREARVPLAMWWCWGRGGWFDNALLVAAESIEEVTGSWGSSLLRLTGIIY